MLAKIQFASNYRRNFKDLSYNEVTINNNLRKVILYNTPTFCFKPENSSYLLKNIKKLRLLGAPLEDF